MPMTCTPKIDTKIPYQITYHKLAQKWNMSYSLPETGTREIWYQITCQTRQKSVPVFWNWFLVRVSLALVYYCFSQERTLTVNCHISPTVRWYILVWLCWDLLHAKTANITDLGVIWLSQTHSRVPHVCEPPCKNITFPVMHVFCY